ncbi:hypothetical protein CGRA01v4_05459 [Colletotrichum graminicola]|nr:hypothetical protein CGRA01v4_05459 [Colletotrichum graminicola]
MGGSGVNEADGTWWSVRSARGGGCFCLFRCRWNRRIVCFKSEGKMPRIQAPMCWNNLLMAAIVVKPAALVDGCDQRC